jgi:hypothetical protein
MQRPARLERILYSWYGTAHLKDFLRGSQHTSRSKDSLCEILCDWQHPMQRQISGHQDLASWTIPFLSQVQHPDIIFYLDHKLPVSVTIYINLGELEITHPHAHILYQIPCH